MGFQLPWTSMVCWSYGLVASTFALFVVASVGMWRECQPQISLIPPSVGLNSLLLIQWLFLCPVPGVFFLTPCVTSCYFSTNVGRHNTAGRAKQHSVSQTAECIHAEKNSQFQSELKIKSIRNTYKYCSPLLWLCCFPLHMLSLLTWTVATARTRLYFYFCSILLRLPQTAVKRVFLNYSQATYRLIPSSELMFILCFVFYRRVWPVPIIYYKYSLW